MARTTRRRASVGRLPIAMAIGALTAALATTAVGAAVAAPTIPNAPTAAPGTALVRVAHLSPDTAGVDVYVDGTRAIGNINFQTVSNYQTVPAGRHRLELRPAGASATSAPVLSTTRELVSQGAYTVAGVGLRARLRGAVYADDLATPPAGAARVRAIHAAVGVPAVDVSFDGGPQLGSAVAFGTATPYADVPPGRYDLSVRTHAGGKVVLTVPGVDVGAGVVYSVAVIGGAANSPVQALALVDARGVAVLPAGAVRTGGGGTAAPSSPFNGPQALLEAVGGAALLAGVAIASVRSRARRPAER